MRSRAVRRPLPCWLSIALGPPPSRICSSSLRTAETRSARKRIFASNRGEVASTRVLRMELTTVSEAMILRLLTYPRRADGRKLGLALQTVTFALTRTNMGGPGFQRQSVGLFRPASRFWLYRLPQLVWIRGILFTMAYEQSLTTDLDRAGLCSKCEWARVIKSDRGSTFLLCKRSTVDASFPKYPRLPVICCPGYEQKSRD